MPKPLSYKAAGVDIDNADATKQAMAKSLETDNPLVLNKIGAFASLVDGAFPGYEHPVLVCKTEEPGSKQKIAFQYERVEGICFDLINHLIDDMIVMGAKPLFIQDLIICGKLEKKTVNLIVDSIAKACKAQGCALTGGETSEQPGVLEPGVYVLGASGIGVVEKKQIIDGSKIAKGDTVIALPSNGLHTNGYTLVRALIKEKPEILNTKVGQLSFLDAILLPHTCYYQPLKDLFGHDGLHGLAHITGGGFEGNINRILPGHLDAQIDLGKIRVPEIFTLIKREGNVDEKDMLKTYNMGVGIAAVVAKDAVKEIIAHLKNKGCDAYEIGTILDGKKTVQLKGSIQW